MTWMGAAVGWVVGTLLGLALMIFGWGLSLAILERRGNRREDLWRGGNGIRVSAALRGRGRWFRPGRLALQVGQVVWMPWFGRGALDLAGAPLVDVVEDFPGAVITLRDGPQGVTRLRVRRSDVLTLVRAMYALGAPFLEPDDVARREGERDVEYLARLAALDRRVPPIGRGPRHFRWGWGALGALAWMALVIAAVVWRARAGQDRAGVAWGLSSGFTGTAGWPVLLLLVCGGFWVSSVRGTRAARSSPPRDQPALVTRDCSAMPVLLMSDERGVYSVPLAGRVSRLPAGPVTVRVRGELVGGGHLVLDGVLQGAGPAPRPRLRPVGSVAALDPPALVALLDPVGAIRAGTHPEYQRWASAPRPGPSQRSVTVVAVA